MIKAHFKMSLSFLQISIQSNFYLYYQVKYYQNLKKLLHLGNYYDCIDSARNFEKQNVVCYISFLFVHQVTWASTTVRATFILLIGSRRSSNIKDSR